MDNLRGGIDCFEKALKILSISHGEKHELVGMLKENLQSESFEMHQKEQYKNFENYNIKWEEEHAE